MGRGARRVITLIGAGSSGDYRIIVIRRAKPQTFIASKNRSAGTRRSLSVPALHSDSPGREQVGG